MNSSIVGLLLLIFVALVWLMPAEGPGALVMCAVVSAPTLLLLARTQDEKTFLLRMFLIGLMVRILLAAVINMGHMEEFFGGDANTYDIFGQSLLEGLQGNGYHWQKYQSFVASGAGAWGMLYLVAGIYAAVGRNLLAVQLVNASIGAVTGVVVYYTATSLFNNVRVAKLAALLVTFFPSLILWSSQALKDGLIILALSISILATLRLMEKITVGWVAVITVSLLTLLSLRFYILYMMTAAVAGSFVMGMKTLSAQGFVQRFVAVTAIGLAFTWFGVLNYANSQFDRFANLKQIQLSRQDQSEAGSGFGKDVDITTTEGALSVIPLGVVYLLFAPFPWQFSTLRQSITLPEMIVWWFSFPLLVLGMWYSIKHRLRQVSPIVIFTTMLTLVYSVFQGNVGTAYRQRSQLLVFYFIFVAVGGIIMKERAENRRLQAQMAKQELKDLQAARVLARRKTVMGQS
jgi:hypothetical protein